LWVSDDEPPAAAAPPWVAQGGLAAQHGAGSSRETGGRPEGGGVYLTDGSYDDDSFYSSPVGTADPGDFGAPAHSSDAPAATTVYDGPPSHPSDPYNLAPPAYTSPPSDPYNAAAPSHNPSASPASDTAPPAWDTPASQPDPFGSAPPSYDRPPEHPADRYGTPTASYDGQAGGFGAPPPAYDAQARSPYSDPPAPGGPAGPYGSSQEQLPGPKTSGWATVSLVVGICCGAVIGAVLGVIALGKIRRTGERGSLLAACGIVLSAFWTLLLIVLLVVVTGSPGSATRGANGQISHGGKLNVFSLAVGDCFDNPASQQDIASVTAVPCTEPHDAQVFASFDLPGTDTNYPGNLTQLASNGCNAQQDHLNQALVTDSMSIRFIYPVQHAWQSGERTVTCLVVTPANVSSSLLNH
jgi:Domain of unknown function (DUF4190)/Septum formation